MAVSWYAFAAYLLKTLSTKRDRVNSSIRRILKGGGGGGGTNFRKLEKNKDLNQKLFHPTSVRFSPKIRRGAKKKGLHSNLVRFFAQN